MIKILLASSILLSGCVAILPEIEKVAEQAAIQAAETIITDVTAPESPK
jgi:starvation-inducible outer membrane lipoprotein